MSWNLPPGCTDRDVDMAAGGYDEEPEDSAKYSEPWEDDAPSELIAQWDEADEGDARFSHEFESADQWPEIPTLKRIEVKVQRLTAPEMLPEVA